jgi:hypothetical protein
LAQKEGSYGEAETFSLEGEYMHAIGIPKV